MAGLSIWGFLFVVGFRELVSVVEVKNLGPCFLGHFDCAGNSQAFVASGAAKDPVKVRIRFDVLPGVDGPGFG